MIRVTVWNEFYHEREYEGIRKIYPDGIHECIKGFLLTDTQIKVHTATFDEPEHGLMEEVLNNTDVLIIWSHGKQEEFADEVAMRVKDYVHMGMGLIALHSAHYSKIMKLLLGTSMTLRWRHGDRERLWCTSPAHPIAAGIPQYVEIPEEEMYGEYFDIPKPDDVIFTGWFASGEVFRSGCTFTRGYGKIFYFQPGHEEYPIYYMPEIQQIIKNAVYWAIPVKRCGDPIQCVEVIKTPEMEIKQSLMKLSVFYDHLREASEQRNLPMIHILKEAKQCGIDGIEISLSCLLDNQETILREITEVGMSISCIYEFHSWDRGNDITYGKKQVDVAQLVGAKNILVIPGFVSEKEAEVLSQRGATYEEVAAAMNQNEKVQNMKEALIDLVAYAKEREITVTLEDFDGFTAPFAMKNQLLWFMRQVPGLKFTMDTGNFVFSDEDAWSSYQQLRDYVVHVHCKDRGKEEIISKDYQWNKGMAACPTGNGYMPIKQIVEDLLHMGYEGYLAIEHFGAEDQLEYMRNSAEYLNSILNKH